MITAHFQLSEVNGQVLRLEFCNNNNASGCGPLSASKFMAQRLCYLQRSALRYSNFRKADYTQPASFYFRVGQCRTPI